MFTLRVSLVFVFFTCENDFFACNLQHLSHAFMNLLLLEPYLGGSHQSWAEGYQRHSRHHVDLLGLPGRHWKWRMHGGAVSLAKQVAALSEPPDAVLATDMLDLATFLGLAHRHLLGVPVGVYFHENQLTYPWSPDDLDPALQRDNHYAFINYTTALAADRVYFNSPFHRTAFLEALPGFLRQFPDRRELDSMELIAAKSQVLPLGLDLHRFGSAPRGRNAIPVILWNHRWEYDKNPEGFFELLFQLQADGLDFRLIVLGQSYGRVPPIFAEAKARLQGRILHWGYADSAEEYIRLLCMADLLPVTSHQDFFGGSTVEAIYCGAYPLLPDRLAYPMHLPGSHHDAHLFPTQRILYQKASHFLRHFPAISTDPTLRDHVERYDWRTLVTEYDETLNSLASC